MFWRTEPVMPNVYCNAHSCTITFLRHIWHRSFFFSSQQAWINCISIVRAFYILRLLHFIALLTSTFDFFFEKGNCGMYLSGDGRLYYKVASCHIPF
jgi:hypothetical protein